MPPGAEKGACSVHSTHRPGIAVSPGTVHPSLALLKTKPWPNTEFQMALDGTWLKGRASSGLAAFTSCRCAKPLHAKCVLPSPPAKRQTFSSLPFFQSAQALISETPDPGQSMGRAGGSGAAAGIRPSAGNQKPTARAETGTDRVLGCLGGEGPYRLWLLFITHKSFAFY